MLTDLLIVAAGTLALSSAVGLAILTMVRRQAEVSPRHRAGVPIRWIAHPGEPAALTRRLRRAVLSVRLVIPTPRRHHEASRQQELADGIEQLAAATARQLVAAGLMERRQRAMALAPLRRQVTSVEELSRRLVADASELDPDRPDPLEWDRRMTQIADELTARDAARKELSLVENATRLVAQAPEHLDVGSEAGWSQRHPEG